MNKGEWKGELLYDILEELLGNGDYSRLGLVHAIMTKATSI